MGKHIKVHSNIKKNCAICDSESFFLKRINRFNINKCLGCGLEFTHPMPTKECLENFYNRYCDFRAQDVVTRRNAVRNLNFLQKEFTTVDLCMIIYKKDGRNCNMDILKCY